uniref:Uncharacterized protein n=1 Tax=mine drainage metagenome TaxID=410659 RepID=E6QW72_9ZZZZ
MDKSNKQHLVVIEGGRSEIESRLVTALFTPYLPNNQEVIEQLAEQLKPRLTPASLTLFSQ